MAATLLQLRIAATRDGGFLWRAAVRPPMTLTMGRLPTALLPVDDPAAPGDQPLFSLGRSSALLEFRPEWSLTMFRDERPVPGRRLVEEGTAFQRGRRHMIQMAPGSRGSLTLGAIRLLFKWEEVPDGPVAEVPMRDVGDVPRCGGCGLALRGVLVREGLLARCDSCRRMNCFVDADEPYRRPSTPTGEVGAQSAKVSTLSDERDTLLDLPIFAPITRTHLDPLPELERPSGQAGSDPVFPQDAGLAAERLKTVLARFPAVQGPGITRASMRDAVELPALRVLAAHWDPPPQAEQLEDAFWSAEIEAIVPSPATIDGPLGAAEPAVPWRTLSVLSARTEYEPSQGRIPRAEVRDAVRQQGTTPQGDRLWSAPIIAATGVGVLLVGLLAMWMIDGGGTPAISPAELAPEAPSAASALELDLSQRPSRPPQPRTEAVGRIQVPRATYIKYLPGDPTPISVLVAGFAIDRTEVTLGAFRDFLATTGRDPPEAWKDWPVPEDTLRPVTGVRVADARAFCAWNKGRLPQENEWERAAVGTGGRSYPWGNSYQAAVVAVAGTTEPVGSHPEGASELGVLDLIGNAVEWVEGADGAPQLRGGGAHPWNRREDLQVFQGLAPDSAPWTPGPGFRCAYPPG